MKRILRLGVNIDHVATIRNARGGPDPDPGLVKTLIEQTPRPADLMDIVFRIGDEIVPWLLDQVRATDDENRLLGLLRILAHVGTHDARAALIASRSVHPRLAEEAHEHDGEGYEIPPQGEGEG